MAITEESRHRLHQRLEKVLGEEPATTLMEHLPQRGWAEMATKRDLDQLQGATKRDLDQLQAATKRDLDQLQGATKRDIDQLQAATKRDLDQVQSALKRDIDHLGEVMDLRFARVNEAMATKQDLHKGLRSVVVTMVVTNLAFWGLALATLRAL